MILILATTTVLLLYYHINTATTTNVELHEEIYKSTSLERYFVLGVFCILKYQQHQYYSPVQQSTVVVVVLKVVFASIKT